MVRIKFAYFFQPFRARQRLVTRPAIGVVSNDRLLRRHLL